jgi:hypothetical protein
MSNMKTNPSEQLQTIDPAALAQVSGGATATATTTSADQVMTALTGILESIQSLAGQRDSGSGMNQQEMMMLMMMMQQRNQQQAAAAVAATSWWNQEPIVRYY